MVGTIQTSASPWHLNNQRSLVGAIAQMRTALETDLAETTESWHSSYLTEASPVTLNALSQIFHLSRFEQCLLLLCAGMELDGQWGTLCAAAQGDPQRPFPTLSLALSFLPEPCWQALAPQAALRHWRLIEIGHGNALTTSPLRIDEQILHYLTGTPSQDSRLAGFVEPMSLEMDLVPSHQQIVSQITAYWMQAAAVQPTPGLLPVIQLWGEDSLSKQAIASQTCQELDLQIIKLSAEVLPTDISQIILIKEICEREYLLNNTAILLDCDYLENTDGTREHAIARFIESIQVPLIVMGRDRRPQRQRALLPIQINAPTLEEQRVLWRKALNSPHELTNGEYPETIQGDDKDHSSARSTNQFIDDPIDTLVSYFNLSSSSIHAISLQDRTPLTSDTALS
ncbi:MAG: hypothetical protein MUF49_11250, partial [Oculatellaceae cyanobacterium Prado106]|nr:hypothetical protein [Oculatellaceae cyanobacterium Prado106]